MRDLSGKYNLPSAFAEHIGMEYACTTAGKHKKESGQYFTPKRIADFMSELAQPKTGKVSILDPGCGTGILSCSLIEKLIQKKILQKLN